MIIYYDNHRLVIYGTHIESLDFDFASHLIFIHRRTLPLVYLFQPLAQTGALSTDDRLLWEIRLPNSRRAASVLYVATGCLIIQRLNIILCYLPLLVMRFSHAVSENLVVIPCEIRSAACSTFICFFWCISQFPQSFISLTIVQVISYTLAADVIRRQKSKDTSVSLFFFLKQLISQVFYERPSEHVLLLVFSVLSS